MDTTSVVKATAADGAPVARYYALFSLLKAGIKGGEFQPGMRLPTVTELVDRYKVSRTTVARALDELEKAGLVESRWGAGTFVTPVIIPTIEVIIAGGRPRPGRHRATFFDHLLEAVREGFGEPARRVTMNYTLEQAPSADEIIGVAQARRAECIITYRPDAPLRAELAVVAARMPVVSLFHEIPGSRADSVLMDPRETVDAILSRRLAAGRRLFVYVACSVLHTDPESSPYHRVHSAFMESATRIGIVPRVLTCQSVDLSAPADQGFAEQLRALPQDAVVFADALGRIDFPGEKYQFTESPETRHALQARGIGVLYMDFSRACRAAAELVSRRRDSDGEAQGRILRVQPELVPAGDPVVS